MHDSFTIQELQTLIAHQGAPAVSIYLPTHRVTTYLPQDTIRLKNLLRRAEEDLAAAGIRTPEIRDLLAPAEAKLADTEFLKHLSDGLALFLTPGQEWIYRLPHAFEEHVSVNERFYIKPLLPLVTNDGVFYVLAVSQNQVRVLRGDKLSVDELDPTGVPGSLAEALRFDEIDKGAQFEFHFASTAGAGRGETMLHSRGGVKEDDKERLLRYFRAIDKGLQAMLRGQHAPLVFAGVDYLLPIYRAANTYPHLMDAGITGNPEELRPEQLHEAAWEIVAPHFARAQSQALETLDQLAATNQAALDIREALPAAYQGRVETAFVPLNTVCWGRFDPDQNHVSVEEEPAPGSQELCDELAVYTLLRGGQVFAVDPAQLPNGAKVAAILRF